MVLGSSISGDRLMSKRLHISSTVQGQLSPPNSGRCYQRRSKCTSIDTNAFDHVLVQEQLTELQKLHEVRTDGMYAGRVL
jgi:hypothetical protein